MTDSTVVPEYRHVPIGYLDDYGGLVRVDPKLSFITQYPLRPGVAELESYVKSGRRILFRDEGLLELLRSHLRVDVSGLKQQFDPHSVVGVLEAIRAELIARLNFGEGTRLVSGGLSELPGRRDLLADLKRLRNGQPVALLFVDLDGFKALNDRVSHAAGDACLDRIADTLITVATDRGVVYRYGGDEFVIVLRNATCDEATASAERVRRGVEAAELNHGTQVTTSIGVASTETTTPEALLQAADEAMYAAKATGKNCVVSQPLTEALQRALLSFRASGVRDR